MKRKFLVCQGRTNRVVEAEGPEALWPVIGARFPEPGVVGRLAEDVWRGDSASRGDWSIQPFEGGKDE